MRLEVPDPRRLTMAMVRMACRSEVVRLPLRRLERAEAAGVSLLSRRLDAVDRQGLPPATGMQGASYDDRAVALQARLEHLLTRSVAQSTNGGRSELYMALLNQLVPDEARILVALSGGRAAAVVHIVPRSGRSAAVAPLLENASSVGRSAGVVLVSLVPTYVTHLLQLGLVELGAEDDALELEYELLLAETTVRQAIVEGRRTGRFAPRVVRRTLRLSELGRDLLVACQATGVTRSY